MSEMPRHEIDLTLHVDPTTGKPSGELMVSEQLEKGAEISAEVDVDQAGKPTVTVGVRIPF